MSTAYRRSSLSCGGIFAVSRCSSLLFVVLWMMASAPVAEPNLFARMVQPMKKSKDEETQHPVAGPPSGATSARGSTAQVGNVISNEDGVLMANLLNNNKIPLVGIGVGNSPSHHVSPLVSAGLQNDKRIRLIDTTHSNGNEEAVARGVLHGVEQVWSRQVGKKKRVPVHVLTKVWYTHLGYERTKVCTHHGNVVCVV